MHACLISKFMVQNILQLQINLVARLSMLCECSQSEATVNSLSKFREVKKKMMAA